jgi:N-acetylglucosaminyldiphosphoundecaprenol N-acetyl-beta-D-mannosaminyltransferase
MSAKRRIEILGVPVDCLDWPSALRWVATELAAPGPPRTILAVNPEKVIRARADHQLLEALRRAALLVPDGIGVVAAARLLRLGRMQRVAGSELMPRICEIAAKQGSGVFLFGAAEAVNAKAAETLTRTYPGLRITGRHHGFVADKDMPRVLQSINESGAEVLFVGLGSPRQELWMQRHLGQLEVRLCQGVGGTLDVLAGAVKRAPAAFIHLHLEWLYRLLSDPRRLARQSALPKFALRVLSAWVTRTAQP